MPKTILVVDDEPDLLREVKEWLEGEGYDVLTSTEGKEGLDQAIERTPQMILLDVTMPRMDGFEFLKVLRGNRKTSSTPVVMLTARGDTEHILKAQSMNVSDYVIKPFDETELLELIEKYTR